MWSGRLICDAVEGFTTQPLNVPFEVTVRRGVATYARPVLSSQSARTGVWERGEGRVGADGAVVLDGGAGGRGFLYTARSCPWAWCNWRRGTAFAGLGRAGQLAIAGRLTAGSSLKGAMVSRDM